MQDFNDILKTNNNILEGVEVDEKYRMAVVGMVSHPIEGNKPVYSYNVVLALLIEEHKGAEVIDEIIHDLQVEKGYIIMHSV